MLKKIFCLLLLVFFMGSPAIAQSSSSGPAVKFGINVFAGAELTPNMIGEVESVPETLRRVPGHPDDFRSGNRPTFLIPGISQFKRGNSRMNAGGGPELLIKDKISVRGGLNFNFFFSQFPKLESGGNTQEINHEGTTERGTGRSLVYYTLQIGAKKPGYYAEVEFRAMRRISLVGGGKFTELFLISQRGYDRFNASEKLDEIKVAKIRSVAPYAGIKIGGGNEDSQGGLLIYAGPSYNQRSDLIHPALRVETKKSGFVVGVAISGSFFFGQN